MSFKNNIKTKIDTWNTKHKIKKEQYFYDNMLKSNDEKATEVIFNRTSLAWLIVLVTLLLQLISLATTYKGSIVYFGGVELPLNLSAPLLFALAIQLIVFCVGHTLRANLKKGLIIVLIMATLCSTYFSYIGIYNYINSPINYLEERYKQIYDNLSDKYDVIKENNKGSMTKTALNIINNISTSYSTLSMEVEKNNSLSEEIANISIDSGLIDSQVGTVSMPKIYNYGDNLEQYYADMAKYNATIGNMITDSTRQESTLKNELYNAQVEAILGGKTHEQFLTESIETKTKKDQLEKGIASIHGLINAEGDASSFDEKLLNIQEYCQNFIQGVDGDKDIYSSILVNLNSQNLVVNDSNSINDLQNQINEFLIVNKKDTTVMKSLDDLKMLVSENSNGVTSPTEITLAEKDAMELYSLMDAELKGAIYTLNQLSINDEKIDINDKEFVIQNLYVLPITNLIYPNEGRSMAWFCLLFAILVDGLTLVFAIMEGKESSPLFAKSTKQVIGTSKEAMENVLMLSLLSGDTISKDEERISTTLSKLERFIKSFNLTTETLENGYSMYCPISKLQDYQVFLATLCQFNLAIIVSSKEMLTNNTIDNVIEENYVLIKSKFVIWANEKIVALTLNNQYIDSLNSANENFEMNGELL